MFESSLQRTHGIMGALCRMSVESNASSQSAPAHNIARTPNAQTQMGPIHWACELKRVRVAKELLEGLETSNTSSVHLFSMSHAVLVNHAVLLLLRLSLASARQGGPSSEGAVSVSEKRPLRTHVSTLTCQPVLKRSTIQQTSTTVNRNIRTIGDSFKFQRYILVAATEKTHQRNLIADAESTTPIRDHGSTYGDKQ